MVSFEIYFSDLTAEAQKDLMEIVGITDPSEMNWDMDIVPLGMIDIEADTELYPETEVDR